MTHQQHPQPVWPWWPDSLTVAHMITELATEAAAGRVEEQDPGFRFSTSMHDPSPGWDEWFRNAPGVPEAVSRAVRSYQPSDQLQEALDQDVRQLARQAFSQLPQEQKTALIEHAARRLMEKSRRPGPAGPG